MPNPYGQKPLYGAQQPLGQIPGNDEHATSVSAAGGADSAQFAGQSAQGYVGQYVEPPYASVCGTRQMAFRYYDQNRVGYIKDLVQTALAESSSATDNRVIYSKLVDMVDL